MSEANGKVCCNCRHNIRDEDNIGYIKNKCDIDGQYLRYLQVLTGWCRHWAKSKKFDEAKK